MATNDIGELQFRVTETLFLAEEKTREAARLWDQVAELQSELMDALEAGTTEQELAARGVVDAKQSANRVWLALGGRIVGDTDDEETPKTDPSPKEN